MNEVKQLVKEKLDEAAKGKFEDNNYYQRELTAERRSQQREWREQQRHLRNINKGSLLRK